MGVLEQAKWGRDVTIRRWNIMLYGFPGAGKTTFAAGAPRPLVIEVDEGGHQVLDSPSLRDHARYFYFRDYEKVARFVRQLAKDPDLSTVDSIVLDTFTELQTLDRLARLQGDPLIDKEWKFNESVYSRNNFATLLLLKEILKLGKNTIVVCHMVEEQQGEGRNAKTLIRPGLSSTMLKDTLALLDGAFFLNRVDDTRSLRLAGSVGTMTKSRFDFPKKELINPTFNDLLPYLNKRIKPNE